MITAESPDPVDAAREIMLDLGKAAREAGVELPRMRLVPTPKDSTREARIDLNLIDIDTASKLLRILTAARA